MRTFLAVEIPEHSRRLIDNFIQIQAKRELPIKWVRFENLHITLKFLGEIDEGRKQGILPVVADVAKEYRPFTVQLAGLGCFPGPRNPRVLWVGAKQGSEELHEIATELEKALTKFGIKAEQRFHAHLTIGRIKKHCKVDDILAQPISSEPFEADSITLFKSTLRPEGPTYEGLCKFTLG